jgi:hypothetical protein
MSRRPRRNHACSSSIVGTLRCFDSSLPAHVAPASAMVKSAGAGPSTDGSSPAQQPCLSHFEQEFLLHQITDLICNP